MGTPTAAEQPPTAPIQISHERISLTAQLVALIAPFRAHHDPRWYLNGINVRPHPGGGAIIAATNGHMLGAVHDRAAVCEREITLTLHPATVAACAARPNDGRELKMLNGRLVVLGPEGEVCIQPGNPEITGALYPQYERMLPDERRLKPGLVGQYHAGYLAVLDQVAKIVQRAKGPSRPIVFYTVDGDPQTNAIARIPAIPDFVALLMPQRVDVTTAGPMPAWAHASRERGATETPSKAAA